MYRELVKSRHLHQIEVRFAPSLWQMVAADLPAICLSNWVRSSKRDLARSLNFFTIYYYFIKFHSLTNFYKLINFYDFINIYGFTKNYHLTELHNFLKVHKFIKTCKLVNWVRHEQTCLICHQSLCKSIRSSKRDPSRSLLKNIIYFTSLGRILVHFS